MLSKHPITILISAQQLHYRALESSWWDNKIKRNK
jgi:hypothetical protein